jgi:hypothetical protein
MDQNKGICVPLLGQLDSKDVLERAIEGAQADSTTRRGISLVMDILSEGRTKRERRWRCLGNVPR